MGGAEEDGRLGRNIRGQLLLAPAERGVPRMRSEWSHAIVWQVQGRKERWEELREVQPTEGCERV